MEDTMIDKLETTDMFSDRSSVNEAFQYLDDILKTVQAEGGDRIAAYTGAYVLYNTVVNHYNKQLENGDD